MSRFFISIVSITILAVAGVARAQTNPTIRSGRPGQAIGAYTVGQDYLQIQSGLDQSRQTSNKSQNALTQSNVLRYGLSEIFELSAVLNFEHRNFADGPSRPQGGLSEFHLGFRYNLIDHPRGWVPGLSVQTRLKLTAVDADFRNDHPAPVLIAAINHQLPGGTALNHNFGISYDGNTPIPKYFAVSNFSFPVLPKLTGFVELYGNARADYGAVFIDGGFAYLVTNDLQLDTYGGWGHHRDQTETFVSVGVAWRGKFDHHPR